MLAVKRAAASALAGAVMLVLAPDCTVEAPPSAPGGGGATTEAPRAEEATAPGAVIGAAVWRLAWDRSRVVADPRGPGWSVETDLGYRVRVVSGWMIDHSVSLGPCALPQPDGGASWLPIRFGIRSAHAHEDADASAIESMHAEDLVHLADAGPWPSAFPAARYCRAHWLVARATAKTDAPAGLDFAQTSVRVAGTWERDGETGAVSVDTWWPQGNVQDLADVTDPATLAEASADGEMRWAYIDVTRKLGVLFDGIDFATDSEDQVAGKLIDNLVSNARMKITLRRPSPQ
ncbi:MAG: hypothetical protein QM820_00260 [Minicystis sp.]